MHAVLLAAALILAGSAQHISAAKPPYSLDGLTTKQLIELNRSSDDNIRLSAYMQLSVIHGQYIAANPEFAESAGEIPEETRTLANRLSSETSPNFRMCAQALLLSAKNRKGLAFVQESLEQLLKVTNDATRRAEIVLTLRDHYYVRGLPPSAHIMELLDGLMQEKSHQDFVSVLVWQASLMKSDARSLSSALDTVFRNSKGTAQQAAGRAIHSLKEPISPKERQAMVITSFPQ